MVVKDIQRKSTIHSGLLVLRVGMGIMFLTHGYPKIAGGPEVWGGIGSAMGVFGITFAPAMWGFFAALSEFGGGLLLIAGMGVRIAAAFMAFTMAVATAKHLAAGDGISGASHALEAGIVFLSLVVMGAGRFSFDAWLKHRTIGEKPEDHE